MISETLEHKGYSIDVIVDEDPQNPRTEWDNLGTMICFHSRYNLGDKHDYSVEEAQEIANDKNNIVLQLRLYDHSGISMSTSNSYPYNDIWDSGCVGFIYISRDKVRKEYGWKRITKKRLEQIVQYLKGEVECYDNYLTGAVYGFSVKDPEGEEIENGSCWGFYGYDHEKSGLKSEAISQIEWGIENKRKTRLELLKTMIKNKVPCQIRQEKLSAVKQTVKYGEAVK